MIEPLFGFHFPYREAGRRSAAQNLLEQFAGPGAEFFAGNHHPADRELTLERNTVGIDQKRNMRGVFQQFLLQCAPGELRAVVGGEPVVVEDQRVSREVFQVRQQLFRRNGTAAQDGQFTRETDVGAVAFKLLRDSLAVGGGIGQYHDFSECREQLHAQLNVHPVGERHRDSGHVGQIPGALHPGRLRIA